ncbi:hypothetical protein PTTG_28267 [Puccinia triticina 1-1 BBBD Race 1]|uniref:Uncharacterized protein n=1 Tax=Puccinia triticina (isolate 1-1 / race 1 (BBBD)) TaxID=630390 RepID=A0A180GD92_PUCT1|nr:hypothetical protein PTTG_28267 [Puccinia triticina 1-1 BBBD Race 1]
MGLLPRYNPGGIGVQWLVATHTESTTNPTNPQTPAPLSSSAAQSNIKSTTGPPVASGSGSPPSPREELPSPSQPVDPEESPAQPMGPSPEI